MVRRAINGFEGWYEITDCGRVFRVAPGPSTHVGKEISMVVSPSGYITVDLCKNGKVSRRKVHHLVADAFLKNPLSYTEINHLDGDKSNNRAENLQWCSRSMNCRHAYDYGMNRIHERQPVIGQHIGTKTKIMFISMSEAERHGFERKSIRKCCKGLTMQHLGYVWKYFTAAGVPGAPGGIGLSAQ